MTQQNEKETTTESIEEEDIETALVFDTDKRFTHPDNELVAEGFIEAGNRKVRKEYILERGTKSTNTLRVKTHYYEDGEKFNETQSEEYQETTEGYVKNPMKGKEVEATSFIRNNFNAYPTVVITEGWEDMK